MLHFLLSSAGLNKVRIRSRTDARSGTRVQTPKILLPYSILTELNPVVFRQVTNKNKQHFLLFHDPLAALKVKLCNYIFVFTVIIITFTLTLGAAAIFILQ